MKDWREKSVFPTDTEDLTFFSLKCWMLSSLKQATIQMCKNCVRALVKEHHILYFVELLSCQSGTHTHTPSEKKSVVLHIYWLHQLSLTFSVSHTHMTVCFYIKSMHILQPVCVWVDAQCVFCWEWTAVKLNVTLPDSVSSKF